MTIAYIKGQRRQLSPSDIIGKGGEADIYDLGNGQVLKLYKKPNDPDYLSDPDARAGATLRHKEIQGKLPAFPKGTPSTVIAPIDLVFDRESGGKIIGYTMKFIKGGEVLLRLSDKEYREQGAIDGNQVTGIFRSLHKTVDEIHHSKIVIGDFNDLNVLFDSKGQLYVVDADSMQYGQFLTRTFTARFVDPLLCKPGDLILSRPHTTDSDWYAYNTMLFQSLLYVNPFGGVHRPSVGKRLQFEARVFGRITVFNPEVIYPKPAISYDRLSDELLEHFQRTYEKDARGVFPLRLLESIRWTTCSNCGTVHARSACPVCAKPGLVVQAIVRRGKVTSTKVFKTPGQILYADVQSGKLVYLYHHDGSFRRETGNEVLSGGLNPELRYRISGKRTLIGHHKQLFILEPGEQTKTVIVDSVAQLPIFGSNESHYYWAANGQLLKDTALGSDYVGNVLTGRTLFWIGKKFGFGFYQAGEIMRSFVFNTANKGINDSVNLPNIPGQLIDATVAFSDKLAWFLVSYQDNGQLLNSCYVIDSLGKVLASATASQGDDNWLGSGIRGRFAAGGSLFAATDDGIVRVAMSGNGLVVEQEFPDTEPFVDANTQLLPDTGGIYAVSRREIVLLKLN